MIRQFNMGQGIVVARVVETPNCNYFRVRTLGDNTKIFCHANFGGRPEIRRYSLLLRGPATSIPRIDEEVILIRSSTFPTDIGYATAGAWIPISEWEEVRWIADINHSFEAFECDRRINDKPDKTSPTEIPLISGTLRHIIEANPRTETSSDPLGNFHTYRMGMDQHSHRVCWKRRSTDGIRIPCADPRPIQRQLIVPR